MNICYDRRMASLSLSYPVVPHVVNLPWGVTDAQYERFGFTRHNGIDLALAEDQEIYAPFPCKVALVGVQRGGSGLFVCLVSRRTYEFPDGKYARVELTFMHLKEALVTKGTILEEGALIARGGRTGFSTGFHTHMAPKRVKRGLVGYRDLDRNDANNTFDPEPYWSGRYAKDAPAETHTVS